LLAVVDSALPPEERKKLTQPSEWQTPVTPAERGEAVADRVEYQQVAIESIRQGEMPPSQQQYEAEVQKAEDRAEKLQPALASSNAYERDQAIMTTLYAISENSPTLSTGAKPAEGAEAPELTRTTREAHSDTVALAADRAYPTEPSAAYKKEAEAEMPVAERLESEAAKQADRERRAEILDTAKPPSGGSPFTAEEEARIERDRAAREERQRQASGGGGEPASESSYKLSEPELGRKKPSEELRPPSTPDLELEKPKKRRKPEKPEEEE
jgi:hypothetical protein